MITVKGDSIVSKLLTALHIPHRVTFEAERWAEGLFYIIMEIRQQLIDGVQPDPNMVTRILQMFKRATLRGWKSSAENTFGYMLDQQTPPKESALRIAAIVKGGYLLQADFLDLIWSYQSKQLRKTKTL